jgi:hypothetical protein
MFVNCTILVIGSRVLYSPSSDTYAMAWVTQQATARRFENESSLSMPKTVNTLGIVIIKNELL